MHIKPQFEFCTRQRPATDNLIRLWLLRAMTHLRGKDGFFSCLGWEDQGVAHYLGLTDCLDEDGNPDAAAVDKRLNEQLEICERPRVRKTPPQRLARNIECIGKILHLSQTAKTLLAFVTLMDNVRLLANGMVVLNRFTTTDLYHALGVILGLPEPAVRRELRYDGTLIRSGLVKVARRERVTMPGKIQTLSPEFAERLLAETGGLKSVFEEMFFPSPATTLREGDFVHVETQRTIAQGLLRHTGRSAARGVNILIYGEPGVGKTEFARLLAAQAGATLYEVASAGPDGAPFDGEHRLGAYKAAVSLLGRGRNIVLFDEAEDVFGRGAETIGRSSVAQGKKAWMNRALEGNDVPSIWLTNAIGGIDPAFMRRFSMVIHLPPPPRAQLRELVRQVAGDLLPEAAVNRLSEVSNLVPAVVCQAAKVVQAVKMEIGTDRTTEAMRTLIDGTLVAQGHEGVPALPLVEAGTSYSGEYFSADADLTLIADGISLTRSARLCLYGPPGTGKSAFGRWLAEKLGASLHVKRVSDIFSPYVGETECRLAQVFRRASEERALLVFDEVDSLLQDRRSARHSWEVTQVNEMLTQMEAFDGVFIASTNLVDGLDPAAARRFDMKIRFGYLGPEQSKRLLIEYCDLLGLRSDHANVLGAVASIGNLTPGDFASVARRHRFSPLGGAEQFVEALLAESRFKRDGDRSHIGFVRAA